ncbi:hypothetical protein LIER_37736 [Lithospermum erythrorhizon]|uniref:Uncharacterized protein n=1 Tax=Lithospermum erythrorhizon TaxID=34254 RepID=A0AAV3PPU6_LITER
MESIVDVEMNERELIDDIEEPYVSPPKYVPLVPFPKRLERWMVIDDILDVSSPTEGETKQQQSTQDPEPKQEDSVSSPIDDILDVSTQLLFNEPDTSVDTDLLDICAFGLVIENNAHVVCLNDKS